MNRTDTISGIPPCFDDPYNHCNNHSLYVRSFWTSVFFDLLGRPPGRRAAGRCTMVLQTVAQNRRQVFIGTGLLLLIGSLSSALLLAGCSSSSPMIPSIFLMSLWYDKTAPVFDGAQADPTTLVEIAKIVGNANLEARVGYVTCSGIAQR